MARTRLPLLVALASFAAGCPAEEQVPIAFTVPRDAFPEFLEAPWPSDLLRTDDDEDARLSLRSFPNPFESAILDEYLQLFQTAPGYAGSGGLYFHVPAGVDPTSLPPTPADSLGPGASMFLVDVDDPQRRYPIEWRLETEGTSFLPPGAVTVFPVLGSVPTGRAALVVTSGARSADGAPLGPSDDLHKLMGCEPIEGAAVEVDCSDYQALAAALGRPPEQIALLQIVTYQDAGEELDRLAEAARDFGAPAVTHDGLIDDGYSSFLLFEGSVGLAQFQAGTPPFDGFDGTTGGFVFDDDGTPLVQRVEDVRFVLTVPRGTPPAGGWPVVVMGHGTGGDLYSGVGDSEGYEAHQIALAGWAMLTVSEPLHFTREGWREGEEEILSFNFLNPVAGNATWRQSALDKMQLVSAVENLDLHWELTDGHGAIAFDEDRTGYFGHSQGGIVGGLFVAVEDRILGAFLSGAGGGFAPSLIEKKEPVEIGVVVRTLLGLPEDEVMDRFHPLLTLLQIWVDPSDPINYGPRWRWRDARRTPHLVMTSGLLDLATPKRNHGGMAAAYGIPLVSPVAEEVEVLDLVGLEPEGDEVRGNLLDREGAPVTAGLLQYPDYGHFAVYQDPDARDAYRLFFASLLEDGVPTARVRRAP